MIRKANCIMMLIDNPQDLDRSITAGGWPTILPNPFPVQLGESINASYIHIYANHICLCVAIYKLCSYGSTSNIVEAAGVQVQRSSQLINQTID